MAKKFGERLNPMSPESQARAAARTEAMQVKIQLQELRSESITLFEMHIH